MRLLEKVAYVGDVVDQEQSDREPSFPIPPNLDWNQQLVM
jgi:hypothetical protein